MADITLGSATRTNLLSLQSTQSLIDRTQGRLATGLRSTDFNSIMASSAKATGTVGVTTVWGQTGTAAVLAINASIKAIDSALVTVRQVSQSFGTNASLLGIRQDFTANLINTLKGG